MKTFPGPVPYGALIATSGWEGGREGGRKEGLMHTQSGVQKYYIFTFQSVSIDVTKVGHGIAKARVWFSVSSQMRCTENQTA